MRSEQPSPNIVFLGVMRRWGCDLGGGIDRLVRIQVETNATTAPRLARLMREPDTLTSTSHESLS